MFEKNLLFICCFFLTFTAFSQKKGFKLLKKRKYSEAALLFQSNQPNPKYELSANYGFALATSNMKDSLNAWKKGLSSAKKADSLFIQSGKNSIKLIKGKTYNKYSYKPLSKKLNRSIWNTIQDDYPTFDELEYCRTNIPDFFKSTARSSKSKKKITEIVSSTISETESYKVLNSIVLHYKDFLKKETIGKKSNLENRLIYYFLKDIGPYHLEEFLTDHPKHWIKGDCWLEEIVKGYKDQSIDSILSIAYKYPDSYLLWYILKIDFKSRFPKYNEKVKALSIENKNRYNLLVDELNFEDRSWNTNPYGKEKTVDRLKEVRLGIRQFFLVQKAVQNFCDEKDWDAAHYVIQNLKDSISNIKPLNCAMLYYHHKEWLGKVKDILEQEVSLDPIRSLEEVNTRGNETLPFVSPDGKYLYFTAEGRPDNLAKEDPYRVPLKNGKLGMPELISNIAGEKNESVISVNINHTKAVVFIDGTLYESSWNEESWTQPIPIDLPTDGLSWVGKATISRDETMMIFEAKEGEDENTNENIDLYLSRNVDGAWKTPTKLPKVINTHLKERSPYLHLDNKTLFFSSNGQIGLGGMDIYRTERLDDSWENWSVPVNMGKSINTSKDDWGYNFTVTPDGKTAFFSKEITGRKGELMVIGLPKKLRPKAVKLIQLPVATSKPVDIKVLDRNGEVLEIIRGVTQGNTIIAVEAEEELIQIVAESDDVIAIPQIVAIPENFEREIALDTFSPVSFQDLHFSKEAFELPNVRFDRAQSKPRPETLIALKRFFSSTKGAFKIRITGHTDDNGPANLNKRLSLERAQSVKDYLVLLGYQSEKIIVDGKGETDPNVPNDSDINRFKNRRVEFEILE